LEERILRHIESEIEKASEVIRNGGVVLYPTDTIWGLGCDPNNEEAIRKIFRIKRRVESKSLIILVCKADSIKDYVDDPVDIAFDLIDKWNKPLTIVYPRAKNISKMVSGSDNTIAIRVTQERFTKKLMEHLQHPLVSTSANISGQASPVSFSTISDEIKNEVDHIVNYKQSIITKIKPSTIIKINDNGSFEVLRP
jgi:L-threonylcarbamoyladenylate synthase